MLHHFSNKKVIFSLKGSDDRGIDPWMTKASKILISFHSLKTKSQLKLKLFGSYLK